MRQLTYQVHSWGDCKKFGVNEVLIGLALVATFGVVKQPKRHPLTTLMVVVISGFNTLMMATIHVINYRILVVLIFFFLYPILLLLK